MTKQFILLVFLLLNLSALTFAQQFSGNVVDVMDGRTVVIEAADKTRFAVQLQFVEVPAPDTSFAAIAKEHLKKLAVNKPAVYSLLKIVDKINIGKVLIGGIDLSQQILLDGTAWYALPEMNEQKEEERAVYLKLEQQAKSQKSGLWSLPELKPSWVVKAEDEEKRIREMMAENSREAAERQKRREKATANLEMWGASQNKTNAPSNTLSISQIQSDSKKYLNKQLRLNVIVEISNTYAAGYTMTEDEYYAFRITDSSGSFDAYMKRGIQAESLREKVLKSGKEFNAKLTVVIIIKPGKQYSENPVYPEILSHLPMEEPK